MIFSTRILGASIVRQLQERSASTVLQIGRDRFGRADLADIRCFNFIAAARLSKLLDDLHVKDTKDFFERFSPHDLALPQLGAISLAVLGACFELKKLGGAAPLEAWAEKHRKPQEHVVSFHTLKAADRKARTKRTRRVKRSSRTSSSIHQSAT